MNTHSFKQMIAFVFSMLLVVVGLSLIYVGYFVDEKPAFLNKDKGLLEKEKAEEGLYLSSEVAVPVPFSIMFTGDDEDWIEVEIVSVNYGTDKSFLFKVSVGEEQVGIVYFDENEHIQFEGNKEKFERALLKVLKARVDFWKAAEEGWKK